MAAAEVDVLQDVLGGTALIGGLGDFYQHVIAGHLERRHVEFSRPVFAPVPDGVENGEPVGVQPFGAADAPGVFVVARETVEPCLNLALTLLVEPAQPAELAEFIGEDIAQSWQVKNIERSVIEELFRQRAFRPVGFLRVLVEGDTKMFLQQRGQADALAVEQLGGEHRIEQALCAETAEIEKQAHVKIAAVHQQMLFGEQLPERREIHGREHVDEVNFSIDEELEQANTRSVMVEVVGLGIEGGLFRPIQCGQQWRELRRVLNELIYDGRGVQDSNQQDLHRPRGQKRIDEHGQVLTVAAFEHGGRR